MIKLHKLFIFLSLLVFVPLSSCVEVPSKESNIEVNITNEVTNKVVDYENISITEFQNVLKETTKAIERSVVGINAKEATVVNINGELVISEDTVATGSGVIYKREELPDNQGFKYYVVTNAHVLGDGKENYVHYIYDGFEDIEIKASVVGMDVKLDLAVITYEHTTLLQPVEFANSDEIEKGSFVLAVGNPSGHEYFSSVTSGIISGSIRYMMFDTDSDGINDFSSTFIQHDASINPGNSGGGLFTLDGKLIGINTLKLISSNNIDIDNMGFAIPSNVVKHMIENHIEPGIEIQRPRLGITSIEVRDITPYIMQQNNLLPIPEELYAGLSPYGLYITDNVAPNCSFSNTGIEKDDILLEFNGVKVTSLVQISAKMNSMTDYLVGDEISIAYYDRSENVVVKTTVILIAPPSN